MSVDLITLSAGDSTVRIAPSVGGAIASYEWQATHILRRTPDAALVSGAVRRFACYPLLPFSNRIAGASLTWTGGVHALRRYVDDEPHAIHGNAWQRAWSVLRSDAASAALVLDHDAQDERCVEWPFPYRARQTVTLTADALTLGLDIENTGSTPFPFGLGWHPYFPRNERTQLAFTARGVWHTDDTRLPTIYGAASDRGNFLRLRSIGAATLDHCFFGWSPPATLAWPEHGTAVDISADPSCDHLVVFVPHGKNFLALEPVTHMTDAFNRAGPDASMWDAATGQRILVPGARFSCTMRISVRPIVAR